MLYRALQISNHTTHPPFSVRIPEVLGSAILVVPVVRALLVAVVVVSAVAPAVAVALLRPLPLAGAAGPPAVAALVLVALLVVPTRVAVQAEWLPCTVHFNNKCSWMMNSEITINLRENNA